MSKRTKSRRSRARLADRHELYQKSVQCPEAEIKLFDRLYKKRFGRRPTLMREDFCGTAYLCAEWVKHRRKNLAIGVDLDQPTLDWGIEHNITPLGDDAERVTLKNANVLEVTNPKVEVLCALNFSYFIFKTRDELRAYFTAARKSLARDGILVMDCFGGPEAQREVDEERTYKGFRYVWRQQRFDPVSNHCLYHIDFHFPDRSRIRGAFTYDWRLWSIPEIRELLGEAGFEDIEVYWEGTDEDGDGNGVFRKVTRAPADDGWIAYVVAYR